MNTTMLVVNIPIELEEDMVDYLLSREGIDSFTSYDVQGHGEHAALSVAEQVTGLRSRRRFEIVLDEARIPDLIGGLAEAVGRDIIYWRQQVSHFGRIP